MNKREKEKKKKLPLPVETKGSLKNANQGRRVTGTKSLRLKNTTGNVVKVNRTGT
jgi:hypothetical protein